MTALSDDIESCADSLVLSYDELADGTGMSAATLKRATSGKTVPTSTARSSRARP
ncbi:hypothetical protein ABT144_14530 [Streptomyces sp. NPDC002039]|uniref:hypothetical protein n=1 Tax=Streptomyces sp. NPDC002039 TaxID=3154660 RepID=UPI003326525F